MKRFVPEWAVVVRQSLYLAFGAGAVFAGLFYLLDRRADPALLVFLCAAAAAVVFAIEMLYARDHGMGTVEIDADEIRVADRRGERRMRWADVRRVDPVRRGGWRFTPKGTGEKLYVWSDGLRGGWRGPHEVAFAIGEQLAAHGLLGAPPPPEVPPEGAA